MGTDARGSSMGLRDTDEGERDVYKTRRDGRGPANEMANSAHEGQVSEVVLGEDNGSRKRT